MRVRPVGPADREAWLQIRSDFWPDHSPTHLEEIDRFFAGTSNEPSAVLVAEENGNLVGLAELSIRPYAEGCLTDRVGYLEGWYVQPQFRGQGVGRLLLLASETWAREQGCTEFASDTTVDNETSRKTHLACGFEDAGLVRCFRKTL